MMVSPRRTHVGDQPLRRRADRARRQSGLRLLVAALVLLVAGASAAPAGGDSGPLPGGPADVTAPSPPGTRPLAGWLIASPRLVEVAHGVRLVGHVAGASAGPAAVSLVDVRTGTVRPVGEVTVAVDGRIGGAFLVPEDLPPGRWWVDITPSGSGVLRGPLALQVMAEPGWPLVVEPRHLVPGQVLRVRGGGFRSVTPHAEVVLLDQTGTERVRTISPLPAAQVPPHDVDGQVVLPGDVPPGEYRVALEAPAELRSLPVTVSASRVAVEALPDTILRGDTVRVAASGLPAGATAEVELLQEQPQTIVPFATTVAGPDGAIAIEAPLPESLRPRATFVRVRAGDLIGASTPSSFVIAPAAARLFIRPQPVGRGERLHITATGLDSATEATLDLVDPLSAETVSRLATEPVVENSLEADPVVPTTMRPGRYRLAVRLPVGVLVSPEVLTVTPGDGWAIEVPDRVAQGTTFPLVGRRLTPGFSDMRLVALDQPDQVLTNLERVVQQGNGPFDPVEDPNIVRVDPDGGVAAELRVPGWVPPGTYGLVLGDPSGENVVQPLRVVAGDALAVEPVEGVRGSSMEVRGRGFGPYPEGAATSVQVVDETGLDVVAHLTTRTSLVDVRPDGTFAGSVTVPVHLTDGRHRLRLGVYVDEWATTPPRLTVAGGPPTSTTASAEVRQGADLVVSSTGFNNDVRAVSVHLEPEAGFFVQLGTVPVAGPFQMALPVPGTVAPGRHRVVVSGLRLGQPTHLIAVDTVVVPGAAWAASASSPVAQGGNVALRASGYGRLAQRASVALLEPETGRQVRVLGDLPVLDGAVAGELPVPGYVPPGRYDVRWSAYDNTTFVRGQVEVVPGEVPVVEVGAAEVEQGGRLEVRGRGFAATDLDHALHLVDDAGRFVLLGRIDLRQGGFSGWFDVPRDIPVGRAHVAVATTPVFTGPSVEVRPGPPSGVTVRADDVVMAGHPVGLAGHGLPTGASLATFDLIHAASGERVGRLGYLEVTAGRFVGSLVVPRTLAFGDHVLVVSLQGAPEVRLPLRVVPDGAPSRPDTTAPTTTATLSEPPEATGWHVRRGGVTVTFSALDGDQGSGIRGIWLEAVGAQPVARRLLSGGLHRVHVETEGVTTFTYAAVDRAGNVEVERTIIVRYDLEGPQIFFRTPSFSHPVVEVGTRLDAGATDAISGVATLDLTLSVDGAAPAPVTSGHVLAVPGLHVLTVRAVDHAGRSSHVELLRFTAVDPDGPGIAGGGAFAAAPGAYQASGDAEPRDVGEVRVQLSARYARDRSRPVGQLHVQVPSLGQDLHVTDLRWAAVHGRRATVFGLVDDPYRGVLQVTVTVLQGERPRDPDRARVQLVDSTGDLFLDTERERPLDAPPTAALRSGSLQITQR